MGTYITYVAGNIKVDTVIVFNIENVTNTMTLCWKQFKSLFNRKIQLALKMSIRKNLEKDALANIFHLVHGNLNLFVHSSMHGWKILLEGIFCMFISDLWISEICPKNLALLFYGFIWEPTRTCLRLSCVNISLISWNYMSALILENIENVTGISISSRTFWYESVTVIAWPARDHQVDQQHGSCLGGCVNSFATTMNMFSFTVQWRHNMCDGVSNHRGLNCLFELLFGHR